MGAFHTQLESFQEPASLCTPELPILRVKNHQESYQARISRDDQGFLPRREVENPHVGQAEGMELILADEIATRDMVFDQNSGQVGETLEEGVLQCPRSLCQLIADLGQDMGCCEAGSKSRNELEEQFIIFAEVFPRCLLVLPDVPRVDQADRED